VKEIPLTRGYVARIDDEDYELIAQRSWRADVREHTVYAKANSKVSGRRRTIYMHRLLAGVTDRRILVDHKDFDGLNNQRSNIRVATSSQNHFNQRRGSANTSGYKGVYWREDRGYWVANIKIDGRTKNLGRFLSPEDAARAYDAKATEVFGEFAHLNFSL
jgi:hypothetical protein